MKGGVRPTEPQLKRETRVARAQGDTHTAVPVLPPGQGLRTAVSTQLRDGCRGKKGGRAWLAEPWR